MKTPPDVFELRLDHLIGLLDELEKKVSILRTPLLITARHPSEGGANRLSSQRRRELLLRFLPYARYVDVELRSVKSSGLCSNKRAEKNSSIISFHNLKETPNVRTLKAKTRAVRAVGRQQL